MIFLFSLLLGKGFFAWPEFGPGLGILEATQCSNTLEDFSRFLTDKACEKLFCIILIYIFYFDTCRTCSNYAVESKRSGVFPFLGEPVQIIALDRGGIGDYFFRRPSWQTGIYIF